MPRIGDTVRAMPVMREPPPLGTGTWRPRWGWCCAASRGSGFDDLGGALFWVSAQLPTVSSQMPNPGTTPGRVLDIVLEVWAITVVATLAASLAAFFHARQVEHMERETAPGSPAPFDDHRGSEGGLSRS